MKNFILITTILTFLMSCDTKHKSIKSKNEIDISETNFSEIDNYLYYSKKIRLENIENSSKYGNKKYYPLTDKLNQKPIFVVKGKYGYANFRIDDKMDTIIRFELYNGTFKNFENKVKDYAWVRGDFDASNKYTEFEKKTIYIYHDLFIFVDDTNNSKEKRLGFANTKFLNSFLIQ